MKQEIAKLQENNDALQGQIKGLTSEKNILQGDLQSVQQDNANLKEKIDELHEVVSTLQSSEEKIKALISDLTAKVDASSGNEDIKKQLAKLETLQEDTRKEIKSLTQRLNSLEDEAKAEPKAVKAKTKQEEKADTAAETTEQPSPGIFSYFSKEEDKKIFIDKVTEAVSKNMTYAQIDEYLTQSLSKKLDKIAKDHPTLTKTYIRSVRDNNAG